MTSAFDVLLGQVSQMGPVLSALPPEAQRRAYDDLMAELGHGVLPATIREAADEIERIVAALAAARTHRGVTPATTYLMVDRLSGLAAKLRAVV